MSKATPAVAALAFATIMGSTGDARAELVDPGTRPMWAAMSIGPAIPVVPGGSVTQFKLEQEFGYHFSGDSSGPAIGANIGESFGSGLFVFQPGGKFWWDIPVSDDLGIYITPAGKLGYTLATAGGTTGHAFNWSLGVEGRIILGDRGLLFFRPFTLDMFAGDFIDSFAMRYDLMFGGGVTF